MISKRIPSSWCQVDNWLFKERDWEQGGKFYFKVFKVRKWKKFLPDGAAVVKDGYRKRHLTDYSRENLELFIEESCRAELTHLLAIFPFWVFGLFGPIRIIAYMLLYALAINMPCVIVQRFNRPRIVRLLKKGEGYGS